MKEQLNSDTWGWTTETEQEKQNEPVWMWNTNVKWAVVNPTNHEKRGLHFCSWQYRFLTFLGFFCKFKCVTIWFFQQKRVKLVFVNEPSHVL